MIGPPRGGAPAAAALKTGIGVPRTGRLGRLVRRKLIVPYLRLDRSADHSARSVFVGVLVGMTPTLGLHVLLILSLWAIVGKLFPRQKFSLLVAMAWTWVMNPLTVAPLYYLYFVTGRLLLGQGVSLSGFETPETLWALLGTGFESIGLPMLLGCIPWAILAACVSYRWSLRFILARRDRRARRSRVRAGAPS